jgi:hypothetical protein
VADLYHRSEINASLSDTPLTVLTSAPTSITRKLNRGSTYFKSVRTSAHTTYICLLPSTSV